ncbi:hypothetical protein, partial [Staphylococcus aureus]|uniref:hypothetical protein n=1 Tax=Staphylococcus aureus TaxID=1280 RepID=UPI003D0D872B
MYEKKLGFLFLGLMERMLSNLDGFSDINSIQKEKSANVEVVSSLVDTLKNLEKISVKFTLLQLEL